LKTVELLLAVDSSRYPRSKWGLLSDDFYIAAFDRLLSALRTFDETYPKKRRQFGFVLPREAYWYRPFESIGAVRINVGRGTLCLNEFCVKILGLKDRYDEIPRQPGEARAIGDADLSEPDVLPAEAFSADDELSLSVSSEELLQHPEVQQIKVLEEIARTTIALATLETRRADLVARARELGVSWARVGNAAQITPQAALRKWDEAAREKHRGYGMQRDKE
jgi:hypothetical protein